MAQSQIFSASQPPSLPRKHHQAPDLGPDAERFIEVPPDLVRIRLFEAEGDIVGQRLTQFVFEMPSVHEEARVQAYIRTIQYSVCNRPILKYQAADSDYEGV